mmetsp:Transcript_28070/g.47612  ORF Transcript_28070/g.47612 Transcript_28070/m.47612 type:complete len:229 (+) Transcript_28070:1050-1736(+)
MITPPRFLCPTSACFLLPLLWLRVLFLLEDAALLLIPSTPTTVVFFWVGFFLDFIFFFCDDDDADLGMLLGITTPTSLRPVILSVTSNMSAFGSRSSPSLAAACLMKFACSLSAIILPAASTPSHFASWSFKRLRDRNIFPHEEQYPRRLSLALSFSMERRCSSSESPKAILRRRSSLNGTLALLNTFLHVETLTLYPSTPIMISPALTPWYIASPTTPSTTAESFEI